MLRVSEISSDGRRRVAQEKSKTEIFEAGGGSGEKEE